MTQIDKQQQEAEISNPIVCAFRRFFAKMLDASLTAALISLFFYLSPRFIHPASLTWYLLILIGASILFLSLTPFFESAMYLLRGNTPGKYFFGIRMSDYQGSPVSPLVFFIHSICSWFFGSAMALPLVRFLAWAFHAFQVFTRNYTGYDNKLQTRVFSVKTNSWRIVCGSFLILLSFLCTFYFMFLPLFSDMKEHKLSRFELRESDFDELYWDDENTK